MIKNTAVTLKSFNAAAPTSTIEIKQLQIPVPQDGEVVVRLKLRPVNPADIFSLMGVYPGFTPSPQQDNIVPGLEVMGIVHAIGKGVSKLTVGQRVVGCPFPSVSSGQGTWQQFIKAKEHDLLGVPESVDDKAAAQFFVNPVTVVGMLELLNVPKGESVLQTAAGSVLGRQMI